MLDRNLFKLEGMGPIMGVLAVLALLQAGAIAAQAYALSQAIAALWRGDPLNAQAPLIGAFFACFALLSLMRFGQERLLDRFSGRTAARLRSQLLDRAFDKDALIANRVGTAAVTVSATDGIDNIESCIRVVPPKAIGIAATSIPLLAFAYALDPVSGVILTVMLPVIVFFMILLGKQARERAERQYSAYRRLSNRFMDTLRGIDVIESLGAGRREEAAVHRFSEKLRHTTVRTLTTATLSSAVLDLCATFGVAAVAIMLAFRLMDGSMQLPIALCLLMMAPEYFTPIRSFASDFHASLDGKNALAAVLEMAGETSGGKGGENDEGGTRCLPKEPIPCDAAADGPCSEESNDSACALVFEHVTYSYGTGAPALSDASFTVRAGEHVAIVGPSGAGKSTLAALAAGFYSPDEGRVLHGSCESVCDSRLAPSVRFIPQNPHVFRASLLDNVRFYAPSATRSDVERACRITGLDELVAELPDGLDTIVGEGARGLSGGQAHRVALARILLDDNARVLVFDEPTAHLDIETEYELKERMLPIFEGKTVLFATHRLHWLENMNRVIALQDGMIVEDHPTAACAEKRTGRNPDACFTLVNRESVMKRDSKASWDADAGATQGEKSTNSHSAAWARGYLSRYRRHIAVALALGLVASGFAALLMFTSGYLISQTARADVTLFSILLPVAFVQVFGLGKPFARYLERLVSHDWVFKITSDLRRTLFRAARARAGDPERARATGEYLAVLDDDVSHLQNLYLRVAFPAIVAALLALATILVFGTCSLPFATGMAALLAVCTLAAPYAALAATRTTALSAKRKRACEYTALADDIAGAADWAFASRSDDVRNRHAQADASLRVDATRARLINRSIALVSTLLLGAGACLVVAWASRFAAPGANPNWIAAFALGYFPLLESLSSLPTSFASLTEHTDAVVRLGEFAEDASKKDIAQGEKKTPEGTEALACGVAFDSPLDSGIRSDVAPSGRSDSTFALSFTNVSFTYPSSRRRALDGLTLHIPTGQTVAILGRSGAGKTTLIQVARGILAPDEGEAHLFGQQIQQHDEAIPNSLGYLSQTPYLFDRTLRENLSMGAPDVDDEKLMAALDAVGLSEKLKSLDSGLDTPIGETGIGFSGGQAHRIALARVLVADTPLLVVDEPFAALDPDSERALIDTLFEVARKRTLVVVTHHLAQIDRFDRIVFVENGKVALDGAPDDLARESARFAQLLEFDSPTT